MASNLSDDKTPWAISVPDETARSRDIDLDREEEDDVPTGGEFVPISGWAPMNAGQGPAPLNLGTQSVMGGTTTTGMPLVYGLNVPFGSGDDRDAEIANAAENALVEEPRLTTLAAEHIQISVAYGVVGLEGTVPTEADRRIAEETVAHLPHVSAVENRLHVAAAP